MGAYAIPPAPSLAPLLRPASPLPACLSFIEAVITTINARLFLKLYTKPSSPTSSFADFSRGAVDEADEDAVSLRSEILVPPRLGPMSRSGSDATRVGGMMSKDNIFAMKERPGTGASGRPRTGASTRPGTGASGRSTLFG